MVVDEEDDEDLEGDFGSFFWWFDEEHDQFEVGGCGTIRSQIRC